MTLFTLVTQTMGDFVFPIPSSNIEIYWTMLGILFGHSFGSKLDQQLQSTDLFLNSGKLSKWFMKAAMDFLHHWWLGGFLWLYSEGVATFIGKPSWQTPILFFGFGILISDISDIDNIRRRYFNHQDEDEDDT